MTARHDTASAADPTAALKRNVLALTSGSLLWTAGHFGVLAVLPLFLDDQGSDTRSIGFILGATGVAQLCVRPFAGWIVDAFGRRVPLALSLALLSGAAALLFVPAGWVVLANRVLTGAAFSIGTTAFYTLVVEVAPAECRSEIQGYVALGLTLGIGIGPPVAVALYQSLLPEGARPPERLAAVAIGAVSVALLSGACFCATVSAFRPRGRAHPYSLRTSFCKQSGAEIRRLLQMPSATRWFLRTPTLPVIRQSAITAAVSLAGGGRHRVGRHYPAPQGRPQVAHPGKY